MSNDNKINKCIVCDQQIILISEKIITHNISNDQQIKCPISNMKESTYNLLVEKYLDFLSYGY